VYRDSLFPHPDRHFYLCLRMKSRHCFTSCSTCGDTASNSTPTCGLGKEFFGWRNFRNRREVGSLAGLTGTPYDSGDSLREQGISKAGNKRVRAVMIELAWSWLRFQPHSELAKWFERRFEHGSRRMRRIGIVALARKLLVALWKYVDRDGIPAGLIIRTPY